MATCLELVIALNSISWNRLQHRKIVYAVCKRLHFQSLALNILSHKAIIAYYLKFHLVIIVVGVALASHVNMSLYYVFGTLFKVFITK